MVLVFLFIGRFLWRTGRRPDPGGAGQRLGLGWFWFSFSLEGFCVLMPELSVVPQGRPTGGWAPSHADVGRVIRLMLSAVLKSSRTTSVWLLARRWPPACRFAAAPNLPSPGSSNRPSGTPLRPATGAGFPREWHTSGTVSVPFLWR